MDDPGPELAPASDGDGTDRADLTPYAGSTYRVSLAGTPFEGPPVDDAGTLAGRIAPGEEAVAVTFDAECADAFPSVQFLAPGHPLLGQFLTAMRAVEDLPERLRRYVEALSEDAPRPVVSGWGRDGLVARVRSDGSIVEDIERDDLEAWRDQFYRTRTDDVRSS